jgi:hypothetical protein
MPKNSIAKRFAENHFRTSRKINILFMLLSFLHRFHTKNKEVEPVHYKHGNIKLMHMMDPVVKSISKLIAAVPYSVAQK